MLKDIPDIFFNILIFSLLMSNISVKTGTNTKMRRAFNKQKIVCII